MKSLPCGDDGVTAQLRHPDLEGDARPQARLLEEHGEALALEEALLLPGAAALRVAAVPSRLASSSGERSSIVSTLRPRRRPAAGMVITA